MNLSKIEMIFNPKEIRGQVHIIGCGSVGSTVAELLARYGLTNFTLWDMDIVESKNIVNQMFFQQDIGHPKVEAVANLICMINPDAKDDIIIKPNGWHGEQVQGYVFLAVDNIEIRKDFMEKNKYNPNIKGVFDIRTGLYDAQCWAADWMDESMKENLKNSMDFTHEEATASTPVSACGVVQGLAPTVREICCQAVTNFIGFATGKNKVNKMIVVDPYQHSVIAS
jgi:molybdopterin/thiamine biosynthesis adenylyltransferase